MTNTLQTSTISVVIITLNEESNIAQAIRSVNSWAHEVIVIDMESEDGTQEIARSLGALVYSTPKVAAFDGSRAIGVARASGAWILSLDADEVIPFSLGQELVRIARLDTTDICQLPRLNYVLGRPMYHGLHGPNRDMQLRFFRKDKLQYSDRVHAFSIPVEGARSHKISYSEHGAIHHFHALEASQLIEKLNRYTSIEAKQLLADARDGRLWRVIVLPPIFFLNSYFVAGGCFDGWRGLYWAWLMAFYRSTRETKHLQITEEKQGATASNYYCDAVSQLLSEYEPRSTD